MSYTRGPMDDDPVSTIEDLDSPEQSADRQKTARRVYTREAIIGIGLLLLLLAFAVVQWRDAQFKQDQYRDGDRAASAGDWPLARDAFASIPGYRDADLRAADARRMITYTLALSGTVALRKEAGQVGLYYNSGGGWHNLKGSDQESSVLASCPDGSLVYDVPITGQSNALPTPGPGRLPPRQVIVANRQGQPVVALSIDATHYNQFICAADGVWAITASDILSSQGDSHAISPRVTVEHQYFYHAVPASPQPSDPALAITAVMPDGEHLLLSDTSETGGDGTTWHTRLYMADANAANPVLLGDFPGAPGPFPYQTLGDDLLLTMYRPVDTQGTYMNAVLLVGHGQAKSLATTLVIGQTFDEHFEMGVAGINKGKRAGQVLLFWNSPSEASSIIDLIDPANPGATKELHTSNGVLAFGVYSIDPDSGSILLGADNVGDSSTSEFNNAVLIDGDGNLQELGFTLSDRPGSAGDAWVRKGRIVYSSGFTHMGTPSSKVPFEDVFQTLEISKLPDTRQPESLAWAAVPGMLSSEGVSWHAGSDLFTYLTPNGEVHAVNYDGTGDTRIDDGVIGFSQFDTGSP